MILLLVIMLRFGSLFLSVCWYGIASPSLSNVLPTVFLSLRDCLNYVNFPFIL